MKKRSILFFLPLALIVTSCNGLNKGSIFNEKFMKRNFGNTIQTSYVANGPQKSSLNLGTDISNVSSYTQGILQVTKSEGNSGLFSVYTNRYVLPVDKYDASGIGLINNSILNRMFFYGKKTVDGNTTITIYDEEANKLYEGKSGSVNISANVFDVTQREGNEYGVAIIKIDSVIKNYVIYNVDRKLNRIMSAEEYLAKNQYSFDSMSLSLYGHKELMVLVSYEASVGSRLVVYNTKKDKAISSFVIPAEAVGHFSVGNHYIYQVIKPVDERAKKYDFYDSDSGEKFNFDTYSVNYLNGKEHKINTKYIFKNINDSDSLFNKNGVYKYFWASGVRKIEKDKVLSTKRETIIFNERVKPVANVSGINLESIVEFDNYYISTDSGIVYDQKMREVGKISTTSNNYHIVNKNGNFGLVDHTGKFVYQPLAALINPMIDNYYFSVCSDKMEILLMEQNEKVSVTHTFSKDIYSYSGSTASKAHVLLNNKEDGKNYVLDIQSGSLTLAYVPDTSDEYITSFSGSFVGDSISMQGSIYKSGETYYLVSSSTATQYSYTQF